MISKDKSDRVLIYGAVSARSQLLTSLSSDHKMQVVGFVDDNLKLARTTIASVMVYPANIVGEMVKRLPAAKKLGETSLMFLCHPTLKQIEIDNTCKSLKKVVREHFE